MVDCRLKLGAETNPFSFKLLPLEYFITGQKKLRQPLYLSEVGV